MAGLRARPGGWLRGLLSFRRPLQRLVLAVERVAEAVEEQSEILRQAYQITRRPTAQAEAPPAPSTLEITYSDNAEQVLLMDIELQLTQARGVPPSEDEIVAEFDRRSGRR